MKEENFDDVFEKELEDEILFQALEDELNNIGFQSSSKNTDTKKTKSKKKKKKIFGKLKVKTVALLLVTLIANTYAWFIYIATVSANLSMHIKNWNVTFSDGQAEDDFVFTVDRIYPGMDDAQQTITVTNSGETKAKMQLVVQSVKILDSEHYVTSEFAASNPTATVMTTDDLLDKILDDYPFKIHILINNTQYDGSEFTVNSGGSVAVVFKVTWAYETGNTVNEIANNDSIDTAWGSNAYTFMQTASSTDYCIEVKVKMQAVQDNST